MKGTDVTLIISKVTVKCPLCKETFKTRYVLRHHIHEWHSQKEVELLVNKILR